ncbi:hypothetical protein TCAL_15719 [Tigriopus californicus]|uniref:Uncharacterized protein n=1 Tax=Tigriopus californicus TaxID=6832 RepID=A0A553P6U3_TIGCA|nr:hypothetical protein TCAL_15719 [Tigriopus californicus]
MLEQGGRVVEGLGNPRQGLGSAHVFKGKESPESGVQGSRAVIQNTPCGLHVSGLRFPGILVGVAVQNRRLDVGVEAVDDVLCRLGTNAEPLPDLRERDCSSPIADKVCQVIILMDPLELGNSSV